METVKQKERITLMSARNIFFVKPSGDDWEVTKNDVMLSRHPRKDQAISDARRLSRNVISSQVVIYRKDGSIYKPLN